MAKRSNQRWTVATRPIYPSSNSCGLPDLLRQSIDLPTRTAIHIGDSGPGAFVLDRTMKPLPGSTIGFYVDDYRLEPLWSTPAKSLERLADSEPAALIEPDFSIYSDHPFPVAMWNLYRSRWTARWWQKQGFQVIPSLCWNMMTIHGIGFGIPKGSVVACEARPRFKDPELFQWGLERAVKEIQPAAILMYGADDFVRDQVPKGPDYVWLPAWTPGRRMHAQSPAHE